MASGLMFGGRQRLEGCGVIEAAARQNGIALRFTSGTLGFKRNFVLDAVAQNGNVRHPMLNALSYLLPTSASRARNHDTAKLQSL